MALLTSEKFDCLVDIARHRIINGRGFDVDGEPSKAWLLAVEIAKEKEWKAGIAKAAHNDAKVISHDS